MKDRTEEIRNLWESTPKFTLEAGLSMDSPTIIDKALECLEWVTDFQIKYKNEFKPFTGLDAIIGTEDLKQ